MSAALGPLGRAGKLLAALLRPPRTTRPTREGWWFLLAALGLGVAALNTGTNLLYLLVSVLLGLVVVSGILCEQVMRGLRLEPVLPGEIFAGRPTLLGFVLGNAKRRLTSYSVVVESPRVGGGGLQTAYLPVIGPGQERIVTFEERFPRRGRHRLPAITVATRFPFGLFVKAGRYLPRRDVLVFPEVKPLAAPEWQSLGRSGMEPVRRAGHGSGFHGLREYREGDDPRLIHWRSSAKTERLVIRELESETAGAVRLILEETGGAVEPEYLEAALSRAASLASHLIGQGAVVELEGPRLWVPPGRGAPQLRAILEALALFEPGGAAPGASGGPEGSRAAPGGPVLSVIRIPLTPGVGP